MNALNQLEALLIDMDGVLWHGDKALPGLPEFFDRLRGRALKFVLATNNSSKTPAQVQAKLAGMGVSVAQAEILTSGVACALYLKEKAPPGSRVYVIGEDGLNEALSEAGFTLSEDSAKYVIVGKDRGLTWDKLAQASLNIFAGAVFMGTNGDLTLATERGVTHGNGAILAALQAATGIAPIIIGKPEPLMYQQAMIRLGTAPEATAALGDRLETDILGAMRAGIPSILVLTGITTREMLAASEYQPDFVFNGLPELTEQLQIVDFGLPIGPPANPHSEIGNPK